MVPPGPHVITTTLASGDMFIPTVSQWLHVGAGDIWMGRWATDIGRFLPMSDAGEVRMR
jgi:hypothetical protein